MKLDKYIIQGCCNKTQIVFRLDRPVDKFLIELFKANGFQELAHFTAAGLLYVQNNDGVISGPIGSDKLNIKCRRDNCEPFLNNIEQLLLAIT